MSKNCTLEEIAGLLLKTKVLYCARMLALTVMLWGQRWR